MRRWYLSVSGGGFASKLLGVIREALLARYFGTGPVADAFRASLGATLSPAHLLTSRIVQSCFIPLYATYRKERPERARSLFLLMLVFYPSLGLLLGFLLFLFAGPVIHLLLPGFDLDRFALAVAMLRIMSIGIPFYTYTSLLDSLGVAQEDFTIPSLRPAVQNVGMLATIILAASISRPEVIAYGFTGSYILMSVAATWLLCRRNEIPHRIPLDSTLVKETAYALWVLARPLIFVSLLAETYVLGERYLASLVGGGSIASIEYARFLTETLHTLLIVPLGLIGLGYFSTLAIQDLQEKTDRNLARIYIVLIPVSAFFFMNGEIMLRLLYMRGQFDENSLSMTFGALRGLSLGLWAYSARYFLHRIFNARLMNGIVLRGEALLFLSSLLVMFLSYKKLGVFGLGLGTSVGSVLSLFYFSRKVEYEMPLARRCFSVFLPAAVIYIIISWFFGRFVDAGLRPVLQVLFSMVFWGSVMGANADARGLVLSWFRMKRR
ncbi:MAG: hypothetical protein KJ970_17445 [Candidatus Eisenbacteria bacterium]|uniref:Lipid II flippase MurJ n=1 Tax=Eiseniibacteriota bacterium TaxID=2212470 RepID=A0A948S2N2_UNCEI|nr:hypothetical protein [Candidatus Eisenbacteria bacterium]MBU1947566.1 hypothetical protein [Candidatus Eisenbacteria bacterium]MBU2692704.1 hypothetical protein [Candidatus Eisenbacteria bacterium]